MPEEQAIEEAGENTREGRSRSRGSVHAKGKSELGKAARKAARTRRRNTRG